MLVLALASLGCDAPPKQALTNGPASTTGRPVARGGAWTLPGEAEPRAEECLSQNPWARPFDVSITQHAHDFLDGRRPPPGPPLSKGHLEGVFPPVWHVGAQWRVVILVREGHDWIDSRYRKRGYLFYVLREADGPDGEYLLEIRPFLLDEDVRRLRALGADVEQGRFGRPLTATFWARDLSLIALCDGVSGCQYSIRRGGLDRHSGRGNGAHPYENAEGRRGEMPFGDPILAFPISPPGLENPVRYAFNDRGLHASGERNLGWQVIHPTEDGLIFILATATPFPGECGDWQGGGSQVVWKRGDPWWSQVTLLDDALGVPLPGEERVDGHVVRGRLLRPGDADWPQGDPLPPRRGGNLGGARR